MSKILNLVQQKLADNEKNYTLGLSRYKKDAKYLAAHRSQLNYLFKLFEKYFRPGDKFLDIGSLSGYACLGAQIIGYESYGSDKPKYVKAYAPRFNYFGLTNLPCSLKDEDIPYPDNTFNLVLASELIEQYNFHPARFFAEAERVLKVGGHLIVTTPNLMRLNNVAGLMLGRNLQRDGRSEFVNDDVYWEFTSAELAYLIKNSGLTVQKIVYRNFANPDLNWALRFFNKFGGFLVPRRRGNLVAIIRK